MCSVCVRVFATCVLYLNVLCVAGRGCFFSTSETVWCCGLFAVVVQGLFVMGMCLCLCLCLWCADHGVLVFQHWSQEKGKEIQKRVGIVSHYDVDYAVNTTISGPLFYLEVDG